MRSEDPLEHMGELTDTSEADLASDDPARIVGALVRMIRRLSNDIHTLGESVGIINKYNLRQRRLVRGLAFSVGFDILLSLALGLGFVKVNHLSERARDATSLASTTRQATTTRCEAGNEASLKQKLLWDKVLMLSSQSQPGHKPTAQELQVGVEFVDLINHTFVHTDCAALAKNKLIQRPWTSQELQQAQAAATQPPPK